MMRYFVIVGNTYEVFELDGVASYTEALALDLEHFSHGEQCVVIPEDKLAYVAKQLTSADASKQLTPP